MSRGGRDGDGYGAWRCPRQAGGRAGERRLRFTENSTTAHTYPVLRTAHAHDAPRRRRMHCYVPCRARLMPRLAVPARLPCGPVCCGGRGHIPHPMGLAIVCASLLPPGPRASKPNALTNGVAPRRRSTVQRAAGLGLSHSSACGCSCPAPIYRSGHVAVWHCQESRDWGGRDGDVARVVAMLTRVAEVPFRCCSCLMMRGTPIPFPRGRQAQASGSLMRSARDAA